MERYGSAKVTGGELHMDAELKVVEVKRGRVTIRFGGVDHDVRAGDTVELHLTAMVYPS